MPESIAIGDLLLEFPRQGQHRRQPRCVRMTVQPNARMPVPHYHESWDEVTYGLAGTLTFQVDGRDVPVGPGQSVFIRRGVVHSFRNDTRRRPPASPSSPPACSAPVISARLPPWPARRADAPHPGPIPFSVNSLIACPVLPR